MKPKRVIPKIQFDVGHYDFSGSYKYRRKKAFLFYDSLHGGHGAAFGRSQCFLNYETRDNCGCLYPTVAAVAAYRHIKEIARKSNAEARAF